MTMLNATLTGCLVPLVLLWSAPTPEGAPAPGRGAERPARAGAAVPPSRDAQDLLSLSFDNSLTGANGETPSQASGVTYQSGVSNQGAYLAGPALLYYPSANNISATQGTFECWIKPTWNGNDGQTHSFLRYAGGGGILIAKDGANNLRIILNRYGVNPPGGEIGVAVNIGSWLAGQWHHVAFTWSDVTKTLEVYTDGTLQARQTFTITLPPIADATFQIGGDGTGGFASAVLDELRISSVVRSAAAIASRMLTGLTINSWSLNAPATADLWPTWVWWVIPTVTANTNAGVLTLPASVATWASSNPSVAIFDTTLGRVRALAPGVATLTASIGGQSHQLVVNVTTPVLPPVEEPIDPFLSTPAAGYLHRMPVVIIRYFPTQDGINLDATATGTTSTLAALRTNVDLLVKRHKFMLEEGSRFRRFSNSAAPPALGYQVVKIITVYEEIPPGLVASVNPDTYFPDYNQILARFGGDQLVNGLGVKEVWLVQQHYGRISINESDMSSPTTGDISNSYRTNDDQPVYGHTYVTYGINFTRTQAEATHNHGHQLESILAHANNLQDGNTTLWWQQFARPVAAGMTPAARCGNTHFPPNATADYDYTNLTFVASDIMNWQPAGGPTTQVNANTWGNVPYAWPGGSVPPQAVESKWYMFWFESMAGWHNQIPYSGNHLTNWWNFTGDWDAAIQAGLGLYEPGNCTFGLSATSQSFPGAGGSATVTVNSLTGCKWMASSNQPWITITSGRFGSGTGTVSFSVAPNSGPQRTGTLAIADLVYTVTQAAVSASSASVGSPCTLNGPNTGPLLSSSLPLLGSTLTVTVSGGVPNAAFAALVYNFGPPVATPVYGCLVEVNLVNPFDIPLAINAAGQGGFSLLIPNDGALAGATATLQAVTAGATSMTISNGLVLILGS